MDEVFLFGGKEKRLEKEDDSSHIHFSGQNVCLSSAAPPFVLAFLELSIILY